MDLLPEECRTMARAVRPKQVTVIGAGIAGLTAAHELERLGHRVQVLEARLTLGGRLRTHAFTPHGSGPIAELGAMRIPAAHHRTMRMIDQLGLADRVRQFRTLFSDNSAYVETPAGHVRVLAASPILVEEFRKAVAPERDYREETLLCAAWLAASVNAIAPAKFRRTLQADLNVELLDLLERIDVRPFIVRHGGGERIDLNRFFANHRDFAATSRLQHFFDDIITETSSALFRLEGGIDQLALRLAERLRGPVHRGRRVEGLHVTPDGVLVQQRHGLTTMTGHCDYVLCTAPFSVIRGMELSGLAADKTAVIHDMQYWPATKIAVHCREAFWEQDGITGGGSFTGGLVRQTYYPPVENDPRLGAALLASYTIGPDAELLERIPAQQRVATVLAELGAVHPELARPGMVLDTVVQAWGEDPLSMGAASVRWSKDVDTAEAERALAAAPQGRLFFAGEHCSTAPAWIEGAIESGQAAAADIHAAAPPAITVSANGFQRASGGAA
ncbi:flavin monoamine oxidase family protein [Nocardia crassostreae]|uniref:flavin monoamine oxidase family protein n=1 Tax=Nocardia crassostreae TaxID=53428 RepID=UPI00082F0815|nr:NAD(P)/FAD-dependent oxidoreductase [Nocardia crassostreae]